jgi:hypothetical protein
MFAIDPSQKENEDYIRERNLEYLVRARRKAAAMLEVDAKRLPQDPMLKGNGKD